MIDIYDDSEIKLTVKPNNPLIEVKIDHVNQVDCNISCIFNQFIMIFIF